MSRENRFNCFIIVHWSSNPSRIKFVTELHQFLYKQINFSIDLLGSRMRSIMSSKFLEKMTFFCLLSNEDLPLTTSSPLTQVHDRPTCGRTGEFRISFLKFPDRSDFSVEKYVLARRIDAEMRSALRSGKSFFILRKNSSDNLLLYWVRAPDMIATKNDLD